MGAVEKPNAFDRAELFFYDKCLCHLLACSALGNAVGRMTGFSAHIGTSQGIISSGYHSLVYIPTNKLLQKNSGEKKRISPQIATLLKVILIILELVVPIWVNMRLLPSLKKLLLALPSHPFVDKVLISKQSKDYTFATAMIASAMTSVAMNRISLIRKE